VRVDRRFEDRGERALDGAVLGFDRGRGLFGRERRGRGKARQGFEAPGFFVRRDDTRRVFAVRFEARDGLVDLDRFPSLFGFVGGFGGLAGAGFGRAIVEEEAGAGGGVWVQFPV